MPYSCMPHFFIFHTKNNWKLIKIWKKIVPRLFEQIWFKPSLGADFTGSEYHGWCLLKNVSTTSSETELNQHSRRENHRVTMFKEIKHVQFWNMWSNLKSNQLWMESKSTTLSHLWQQITSTIYMARVATNIVEMGCIHLYTYHVWNYFKVT